jgi:hypothetical protein
MGGCHSDLGRPIRGDRLGFTNISRAENPPTRTANLLTPGGLPSPPSPASRPPTPPRTGVRAFSTRGTFAAASGGILIPNPRGWGKGTRRAHVTSCSAGGASCVGRGAQPI